jgi:hypothetical protein
VKIVVEIHSRRLHTVAVFSGAYGALALLVAGLILIGPLEWVDKIPGASVFLALGTLESAICIGMNRRRRWGWRLGVGTYGALTLVGVAGALLGVSVLLFGWGDRHGAHTGASLYVLGFSVSVTLLSGIPFLHLMKGRSELSNPLSPR